MNKRENIKTNCVTTVVFNCDCNVLGSTGSSPGKSSSSKKHKSGTNGSQRFWPANLSKINPDNNEGK